MAPRLPFFLVYSSEEPVSADIVREDNVLIEPDTTAKEIGCRVNFRWALSKKESRIDTGVILKINTKVSLLSVRVGRDGTILPMGSNEQGIGTKKQELEKLKYQRNHAMDNTLQDLAQDLIDNGCESVASRLPTLPSQLRLPKRHSPDVLERLRNSLKALPCYSKGPGKTELWKDSGVWVDYGALTTLKLQHCRPAKRKPKRLFCGILRLLVPQDVLLAPGLSATGSRGCVAFPRDLVNFAVSYVGSANKLAGGAPEEMNFDPVLTVRSLISNEINDKKRPSSALSSASSSDLSSASSSDLSSASSSDLTSASSTDLSSASSTDLSSASSSDLSFDLSSAISTSSSSRTSHNSPHDSPQNSSNNSPHTTPHTSPPTSPQPCTSHLSSHSNSPPPNLSLSSSSLVSPVRPSQSFSSEDHTYTSPSGSTYFDMNKSARQSTIAPVYSTLPFSQY